MRVSDAAGTRLTQRRPARPARRGTPASATYPLHSHNPTTITARRTHEMATTPVLHAYKDCGAPIRVTTVEQQISLHKVADSELSSQDTSQNKGGLPASNPRPNIPLRPSEVDPQAHQIRPSARECARPLVHHTHRAHVSFLADEPVQNDALGVWCAGLMLQSSLQRKAFRATKSIIHTVLWVLLQGGEPEQLFIQRNTHAVNLRPERVSP